MLPNLNKYFFVKTYERLKYGQHNPPTESTIRRIDYVP